MALLTTIDVLKGFMGEDSSLQDALLTRAVTAASDVIESYCDRTFASATYTNELYDGSGTEILTLKNFPIISVTAVKEGGVSLVIGTDPYGATSGDVYPNLEEGNLVRPFSRFFAFRKYYSVTYVAGYATIPAGIVQACVDLAALMVREKDHVGLSAKTSGTQTSQYIRQLPEFSQRTLDLYQNLSIGRVA